MIEKEKNISIYTTFKTGGKARFFSIVKSLNDFKKVIEDFRKDYNNGKIFILGGGSNILFNDIDFEGIVIKNEIKGIYIVDKAESIVEVKGGEVWDDFVAWSVENNFSGLENLSYIPGTVGASPVQNIGAYGAEVKDFIYQVKAIDMVTLEEKTFSNKDCQFSYRNSLFKSIEGKKYFIFSVLFQFKNKELNLNYKDLEIYKNNNEIKSGLDLRNKIIEIRKSKLPDWNVVATAGSFFKNPIISNQKAEELKSKYIDLPVFKYDENNSKISLAWVLDHICNLKGFKKDNVGLYKNQPLVIVSYGASSFEIDEFANYIAKIVKEKIDIDIEREVESVN